MAAPIPDYPSNVPDMLNRTWMSVRGFKYDVNDGYNKLALDLLDWIYPKFDDFHGYQLNPEDLLDFDRIDGDGVVWENRGPVGFVSVGFAITILMVLAGISWCVIKFCCCCLRSRYDSDEESMVDGSEYYKREKFARFSCAVGLGICILFLSFGLFGCFVANEQIHKTILDLPKDIDNSLHDAQLYLNTTVEQIDSIFVKSFFDFSDALLESLGFTTQEHGQFMEEYEKIVTELNSALEGASKMEQNFENAETIFLESKIQISSLFAGCGTEFCKQVGQSGFEAFKMSASYETFKSLLKPKMSEAILEGLRLLRHADPDPTEWRDALYKIGGLLQDDSNKLKDALAFVPINDIRGEIRTVDEEMQDWVAVLYYVVLFACIFLLAIPVVLIIGAIFGSFGSPSRKSSFTRRRGGTFLNCAIFTIFLTAWVFWIVSLVIFTFSGLLSQIICESIRELEKPSTSDPDVTTLTPFVEILQGKIQFGSVGLHRAEPYKLPTYGDIVQSCKQEGSSAYSTFDLETAYNVSDIFDVIMNKLPAIPESAASSKLMSQTFNELTNKLAKISKRLNKMEVHIEKTSEPNVMNLWELRQLAKDPGAQEIEVNLLAELKKLEDSQGHLTATVQQGVKSLGQIMEGIVDLVPKLLETHLTESQSQENKAIYGDPMTQVLSYTNFVFDEISYNVGNCRPLYAALDTTIDLFCYKIAAPLSSFWFSLTLILLLFIPLIVTAILLETLYRRH